MTAPTSPYCTSAQVLYLLRQLFPGTLPPDFSSSTTPTKAEVDQFCTWVSAQIEMEFRAVGFVIPFAAVSGETWPDSQTTFLTFLSSVGTAAHAGGHVLKPAPAMGPGKEGAQGNVYEKIFDGWLARIRENGLHFRANYYAGTKAERVIYSPGAPRTDFLDNLFDPTRHATIAEYTDMIEDVRGELASLDLDWNYMYSLSGKGLGI